MNWPFVLDNYDKEIRREGISCAIQSLHVRQQWSWKQNGTEKLMTLSLSDKIFSPIIFNRILDLYV